MAYKITKTEHNGPAGRHPRDGRTVDIKKGARKARRNDDRKTVEEVL